MKSFLQELAEKIYREHPKLDEVTLVFPNRRAIIYFQKYLSDIITKPVFSPKMVTIEEFIGGFSPLTVPDKLELIHRLYHSYTTVLHGTDEPFDQFYFWGEMLLRDFDEVDKYMIRADHLFKDLSMQKELDSSFDFLTEEQQEFLKSFWAGFDDNITENKRKFLRVWKELLGVYQHFKQQLQEANLAYDGMMHREVASGISSGTIATPSFGGETRIHFIGFNALTGAEEVILSTLVDKGIATIHWDLDDYYINNEAQEAGRFFREYQRDRVLGKTFSNQPPSNFLGTPDVKKAVKIFGAPQPVAQTKFMAQILQDELAKGMHPEETLVVLPDEKLLLPVLHGISGGVEKLNVTMGFPLSSTPMYNLIELLVELQLHQSKKFFNHRQVLAVLGHPYVVVSDIPLANARRKEILKTNWISIPQGYLASEVQLHRLIFQEVDPAVGGLPYQTAFIEYLKSIILEIGSLPALSDLDKEYAFYFLKLLNRLEEIAFQGDEGTEKSKEKARVALLKSFLRLFRQLVRSQKIPFTGEPLRGLQVMGVLETRNLDFKNVFVLSLNEGAFPSFGNRGSYIPFNIRKAYKLPTVEHQDAMYAYLFYRVLQRAENIFLFYNTETDVLGQGEMSRYLQQLIFESNLNISRSTLHNPVQPKAQSAITIEKDGEIMSKISLLNEGSYMFKGISPSALNTYIECRLKFYLRHIAQIKEPKEIEEDLDARVLGNFLHDVMEQFYKQILATKRTSIIEPVDFDNYPIVIDRLIDSIFIGTYNLDPNKKVEYGGQRLVVREIVKRFAHRIVEMDKTHAPFAMEAIEQQGLIYRFKTERSPGYAVIGGKIDRVDRKDGLLRIIDYKTGKDELTFESIPSLFSREGKRNKAAFQTILYALLYKENLPVHINKETVRIVPGLINRVNLFDKGFTFGLTLNKERITDVQEVLPEFESLLKLLVDDLYNPDVPFEQTSDVEACRFCPYQEICGR